MRDIAMYWALRYPADDLYNTKEAVDRLWWSAWGLMWRAIGTTHYLRVAYLSNESCVDGMEVFYSEC